MSDRDKLTYERCRSLLERLLSQLQDSLGEDLLAVALFGSVARGEGRETSDLDLLIVHRGPPEAMPDRFVEVLRALRQSREYRSLAGEGFQPDPYPVFFTGAQLAKHPWLLLDIVDHGIILYDREGVLRRELDRLQQRLRVLGARKVSLPGGLRKWSSWP